MLPLATNTRSKFEWDRLIAEVVAGSCDADTSTPAAAITFVASIDAVGAAAVAKMSSATLVGALATAVTLRSVTVLGAVAW